MKNDTKLKKKTVIESRSLIVSIKSDFGLNQKQIASYLNTQPPIITKLQSDKMNDLPEIALEKRYELLNALKSLRLQLDNEELITEKQKNEGLDKIGLSSDDYFINVLGKKESIKVAILATSLAGIFSCFVTIIGRDYMGYSNMNISKLHQIIPGMLIFFILLGIVIGWTCSYYSWRIIQSKKKFWSSMLLATFISFFATIFFRGLKARDSYLMASIIEGEGKGLLGEPNFEVLATALSIVVCVILIIKFLTVKKRYSHTDLLLFTVFTSILSTCIFSITHQIYELLISLNIIQEGGSPMSLSTAYFKYSFSHPERNIWVWFIAFCFTYFITNFLRLKAIQETKRIQNY